MDRLRLLVVVLGIAVSAWLACGHLLGERFDARVEALRAAGEPVSSTDLASPPVPAERNAAPFLRRARAWWSAHRDELPAVLREDRGAADEWTAAEWSEFVDWLPRAEPYLDLLERAARRPESRFELRWDRGAGMELPSLPVAYAASEVLAAAAFAEARRGGFDRAVDHVETLLALGDHLERPFAITCLVRWTVHGIALTTLADVAHADGARVAAIRARLAPRLRALEDPTRVADVLRGERALARTTIRRWAGGESPRRLLREHAILPLPEHEPGPLDAILAGPLGRPLAWREGLAMLDVLGSALETADATGAPGPPRTSPYGPSWFAPVIARLRRGARRHAVWVRVTRVGLAVEEFRAGHGRWPRALDEVADRLGGAVPRDPFHGRALAYTVRNGRARLAADAPVPHEWMRADAEIAWDARP